MECIATTAVRLALPLALLVNPYALVRLCAPASGSRPALLAAAGVTAVCLNVGVAILLHACGLPLAAPWLARIHWLLALLVWLLGRMRRIAWLPPADRADRPLWGIAAAFALVVFPFTHLAGIDTYKWQDLATAVRVEASVPWLVHPLSLFGFTPRSYPSAQPLLLASIQMLGGLGVEAGYFVMSLLSGWIGLSSAFLLGQRLFAARPQAAWFAFLYAFSPVCMRYNHWATGRGLLVSLLPAFLWGLTALPRPGPCAATLALAILLPLSHKAGWAALGLAAISSLFVPFLPRTDRRWLLGALALLSLAAGALLTPLGGRGAAGIPLALCRKAVTRFGWYVPAAGAGLVLSGAWLTGPGRRRLLPMALLTFPLAFHREMYGALIALPFVAATTADGLFWGLRRHAALAAWLRAAALILTLAGALAVIAHRSLNATPAAVWRAALFIEDLDPQGPFRIVAPEPARAQMQAYVSGCPRFNVSGSPDARVVVRRPPGFGGPLRQQFQAWVNYMRAMVAVAETGTDWYGHKPRVYHVIVSGDGSRPPQGRLLYRREGVEIYAPPGQEVPKGDASAAAPGT